MIQPFHNLERVLTADPGNRGIASLARPGSLEAAARSLIDAGKVVITTGFYIPLAGACETDGPPGAMSLAAALRKLGKEVEFVADQQSIALFRAAGLEPALEYSCDLLVAEATHVVAIERLGRAADGRYYNMRAMDMTAYTAPIDELFLTAAERKQVTIGIGDGGNEIGMGNVRDAVAKSIRFGATIGSTVPVDYLIVAGVSNWGGWGLAAGLSLLTAKDLLPTERRAFADLASVVAAGGVDGVTTEATNTVDGLAWPVHADILAQLRSILVQAGIEPNR